jgi:anti-anti-sigma factor
MSLLLVPRGEYDIFSCRGDMKVSVLPQISPQLSKYIQTCPEKDLVLDLSAVDFIDSSTIRMFINLHKRLELAGKRLCLLSPSPAVAKVLDDVKLSSVFAVYACEPDLEREISGRLRHAYAACTSPESGLARLSCSCPICGSTDVHGYLIDESDYQWVWDGDDPFPVSRTRGTGTQVDVFGLLPVVCSGCLMCSIDFSHFNARRPDGTGPQSTMAPEVAHQLSKQMKTRKKLMESCTTCGKELFDYPRQRVGCYHLYLLAETCTRALATARQADAPFLMGFINYAAVKYAPEDKRDKHIDNTRTWLSQVLADVRPFRCSSVAKTYYILLAIAATTGREREAKELFEGFSAFIKPLCEDKADSTASPHFWFAQAKRLARKDVSTPPLIPQAAGRA